MVTDNSVKEKADPEIDRLFARARELRDQGVDIMQAVGLADLENRLQRWPPAWGDDLHILVYGDFEPPLEDVSLPDLGIRLGAKKREGSVVSDALTVLDAYVSVADKSIASILDAVRRINVFIGAWALTDWAHGYRGWWCYVTHGTGAGAIGKIEPAAVEAAVRGM